MYVPVWKTYLASLFMSPGGHIGGAASLFCFFNLIVNSNPNPLGCPEPANLNQNR